MHGSAFEYYRRLASADWIKTVNFIVIICLSFRFIHFDYYFIGSRLNLIKSKIMFFILDCVKPQIITYIEFNRILTLV